MIELLTQAEWSALTTYTRLQLNDNIYIRNLAYGRLYTKSLLFQRSVYTQKFFSVTRLPNLINKNAKQYRKTWNMGTLLLFFKCQFGQRLWCRSWISEAFYLSFFKKLLLINNNLLIKINIMYTTWETINFKHILKQASQQGQLLAYTSLCHSILEYPDT